MEDRTDRPAIAASAGTVPRNELLRHGVRLVRISIAWMVLEAAVSGWAGTVAGSTLLIAFAADSAIELLSALVLHWRLASELRDAGNHEAVEQAERRASRRAGLLLYALAFYILAAASWGLWQRHAAEASWPGIGVGLVAALGMPLLARAKLRVAEALGSRALRADAMESLTCGYVSWVLLVGLSTNALLGWWWLDSAASLIIVPLLAREAREAIRGDCCHCSGEAD